MANVFNEYGRVWNCGSDDILTFNVQTDANSGLRPVTIRKVVYRPGSSGNGVIFETLSMGTTPTLTLTDDTFNVTSAERITDAAGSALTQSLCVVGYWVNIFKSSTGNNLGWWYIKTSDGSHNYIEVEKNHRTLTNDTGGVYSLSVYNPDSCMIFTTMTSTSGAEVMPDTLDWGDKGRQFDNLSMRAIGGGTADIYLL